jgi:hypothetical protein
MMQLAKWKTIGYAASLFVAGGISGGALGVYETKARLFAPAPEQEMAGRIEKRLKDRLGLSPEQTAKIKPIVYGAARQLRLIRGEMGQRINKVFEDAYTQIAAVLTPEQRAQMEQMQRERRALMQRHFWQEGHRHGDGQGGMGGPGGTEHEGPMRVTPMQPEPTGS